MIYVYRFEKFCTLLNEHLYVKEGDAWRIRAWNNFYGPLIANRDCIQIYPRGHAELLKALETTRILGGLRTKRWTYRLVSEAEAAMILFRAEQV